MLEKSDSIETYLNSVRRLYNQLLAKGIEIPKKVIFAWVLNNLILYYNSLITTITQLIYINGSEAIKLYNLFSNLIDKSKCIRNKEKEKGK